MYVIRRAYFLGGSLKVPWRTLFYGKEVVKGNIRNLTIIEKSASIECIPCILLIVSTFVVVTEVVATQTAVVCEEIKEVTNHFLPTNVCSKPLCNKPSLFLYSVNHISKSIC